MAGLPHQRVELDDTALDLVHVLVMFRHGDRSPITKKVGQNIAMSSDETQFWIAQLAGYDAIETMSSGTEVVLVQDEPAAGGILEVVAPPSPRHGGKWPCGQLTAKGVTEMQEKGRHLRARYAELLADAEAVEDLYVHSTNIRRTIRSAQSVLSGMFPKHFAEANTREHGDQGVSIRIHVDSSNSLGPSHSYELFRDLDRLLADDLKYRAPKGLRATADRIRQVTGLDKGRLIPWSSLREILVCRRAHGLAFPDGFDDNLFNRIHELDAWLWHTLYGKRDFCVGSFRRGVQRFHDRVRAIITGETKHKMTLFSAHDNSVVALMRALQLDITDVIPDYGAQLAFEFFREPTTQRMFVRARFENQYISFMGHSHALLCPASHVLTLAEDFLAHDRPRASY